MANCYKKYDLANKVAVVTGASEGIGRDLALGLAEAGADILACSRREKKLLEVKKCIEQIGRRAEIYALDVRSVSEIEGLKNFAKAEMGKIDILINSAGCSISKPAWDLSENDWDSMVDTGFKGLFFCSQAIGSIMRERGYGKIINLSSTFSRSVTPGRAAYSATKAGIEHLTRALATEWAEHGIRVNALAPTAVKTPSRENALKGALLEKLLARIPLGRLASAEDLLGAVIFLASEASDFVTGQTLFVDGGWTAAS